MYCALAPRAIVGAMPTPLTPYDLTRGARTIAAAIAEWKSGVMEPPDCDAFRIREYLRAIKHSSAGTYDADGDAQWCGAFAGFCLAAAGVKPGLLTQKSPPELGGIGSTYRIDALCKLDERRRIVDADDLNVGDVVCLGRKGRYRFGEHIGIVYAPPSHGEFEAIEGNATGFGPDGQQYEGVVRRSRMCVPTDRVKGFIFGFRPLPGDCI